MTSVQFVFIITVFFNACFTQGALRTNGARWSPVWTAWPALWNGSLTAAAYCRLPTAPCHRQQTSPARPRPRGSSRFRPRPPARTPTWSIKSCRRPHRSIHVKYGSSLLPEKTIQVWSSNMEKSFSFFFFFIYIYQVTANWRERAADCWPVVEIFVPSFKRQHEHFCVSVATNNKTRSRKYTAPMIYKQKL